MHFLPNYIIILLVEEFTLQKFFLQTPYELFILPSKDLTAPLSGLSFCQYLCARNFDSLFHFGRIVSEIVEYKSPTDYLGIDDFYKVYGYAYFYKADTGRENEIPVEELTITFVSTGYPRKMLCHLEKE